MVEIASFALDVQGGDNASGAMVQRAINATRKKFPACLVGAVAVVLAKLARYPAGSRLPRLVHHLTRYRRRLQLVPRSL